MDASGNTADRGWTVPAIISSSRDGSVYWDGTGGGGTGNIQLASGVYFDGQAKYANNGLSAAQISVRYNATSGGTILFQTAAAGSGVIPWNNQMVIDGTTGNVGIGTTSPGTRLHVEAPSNAYGLYVKAGGGGYEPLIVQNAAGTNYFTIKGDGRVGIGVSDPGSILGIAGLPTGPQAGGKRGALCIDNGGNVFIVEAGNCYP